MERAASAPTLTTTTFALCELLSLEWHVYATKKTTKRAAKSGTKQADDTALASFSQRLQQRNALCVLQGTPSELWVFIANGMQSGVPVEPPTGVAETDTGSWTHSAESLDKTIRQQFFAALASVLSRKLLAQDEFVQSHDGFYEPNDAKFIFRCPSLTRLNHVEVYLEEEFPTPVFQLHFRLFEPSNLLTVAVDAVRRDGTMNGAVDVELGDPRCSWERLVGLPSQKDHSMVDVWHLKDGLVPRIIAETKYSDVTPWFRAVSKRKHKHRMDDSDDNGNEDEAKKDENEEDADDDDDDTNQEAEVEADELLRRPVPGGSMKSKRKRDSADSTENGESFAPTSPDTHVNTPDATGPIIRMTLPHDDELHLHVDSEVRRFKRRRRGYKAKAAKGSAFSLTFEPVKAYGTGRSATKSAPPALGSNGVKDAVLDPTQLFSMAKASLSKSGPTFTKPKNEAKPLSVAVSLVESLSHSEQQEALDGRPVKTHPLLQALQDYVDDEAKVKVEESLTSNVSRKVKFLPNAEAFIPPTLRATVGRLSVNHATAEQLRLRLCSDRFKYWQSEYRILQYPKNGRQQRKEQQRRLLLEFDENAFEEYTRQESAKLWNDPDRFKLRDGEISLGVQMAASDAMVTWRQEPHGIKPWSAHTNLQVTAASAVEKNEMVDRVQPYLQSLTSLLKKEDKNEIEVRKTGRDRRWMSFEDYAQAPTQSIDVAAKRIECVRVEKEPKVCVSTLESSYHVEPAIISEYLLRDLHPVAAPKPVDYVIVCPQSPSQWLASLALSYFTCFRSMYAQCHMGDLAPVELGQVEGNRYARVDASNGLLLVDCAESMTDPFANFRAAGKVLNPVLSTGAIKKTQAFSRSAVANVVYLVVPFRRSDVKHKMWALGAFSSGLFGTDNIADVSGWKDSVAIEMVYLDDLYEVEVNPSPFVLMPNCFGLYDRIGGLVRSLRAKKVRRSDHTFMAGTCSQKTLNAASFDEVQLRENPSSTALYVSDNLGFAVISPQESTAARDSSRAVCFTGSEAWKSTSLLHAQHTLSQKREARVLKVALVLALLEEDTDSKDGEVTESAPPSTMTAILRDFHAQSYLTMHPVTMERQSPLPHHLAAISKMNRELQLTSGSQSSRESRQLDSMTVFDGYFEDYDHAREEAVKAIDEYAHASDPAKREELVGTAKSCVDEVERYIRILENEAKNGATPAAKRKMMEQTSLEKEILVGDARAGKSPDSAKDANTKEQMDRCADRIDRNGRHLNEAQRTLAHTEAIAENVANNLMQQRNQLEHTEINVAQTQDDTEEAKGHIRSMAFKAFTSRVVLVVVMLALAIAIVLVSYYKWYPRNKKDYLGILPNSSSSSSSSSG
uniref:MID domain-containing protein n=1 Tax=Phytophthora ramorum TaxID=164328 RepID=H3GVB9_PHYRM